MRIVGSSDAYAALWEAKADRPDAPVCVQVLRKGAVFCGPVRSMFVSRDGAELVEVDLAVWGRATCLARSVRPCGACSC